MLQILLTLKPCSWCRAGMRAFKSFEMKEGIMIARTSFRGPCLTLLDVHHIQKTFRPIPQATENGCKTNCWYVLWAQRDDWREQLLKWVAWTWRNSAISWVSHYLCLGNCLLSISEDAAWRSYWALKQHAPIVKILIEDGDPYALEALYINVSYTYFLLVSSLDLFSFARVLIWPGGMICVI